MSKIRVSGICIKTFMYNPKRIAQENTGQKIRARESNRDVG